MLQNHKSLSHSSSIASAAMSETNVVSTYHRPWSSSERASSGRSGRFASSETSRGPRAAASSSAVRGPGGAFGRAAIASTLLGCRWRAASPASPPTPTPITGPSMEKAMLTVSVGLRVRVLKCYLACLGCLLTRLLEAHCWH